MSKVIVGVSVSPAGLEALRWAVGEARRRGVALVAVRSWQLTASPRSRQLWEWEQAMRAEARRCVLEAFRCGLGGLPADVEVLMSTPAGAAGVALKDVVEEPGDLLVVGASRRRWFGGVTRGCVRSAGCAVLVVPPPVLASVPGRRLAHEVEVALARVAGDRATTPEDLPGEPGPFTP